VGSMGPQCLDIKCDTIPFAVIAISRRGATPPARMMAPRMTFFDSGDVRPRRRRDLLFQRDRWHLQNPAFGRDPAVAKHPHAGETTGMRLWDAIEFDDHSINFPINEKDRSWCGSQFAGSLHSMTNNNTAWGFKSRHPTGANFAFVDGSVRFISQTIDHRTYQLLAAATMVNRSMIPESWFKAPNDFRPLTGTC